MSTKKIAFAILAAFALGLAAGPARAAGHSRDFKVIQAAVKDGPRGRAAAGREVRWFKVLVADGRSAEPQLRITLPVALIELLVASTDSRHYRFDDRHCDVDLKAIWRALKEAGPMALVQIEDEGAVIKIWLE